MYTPIVKNFMVSYANDKNLICLVNSIDYGFGFDDYHEVTERNKLLICFAPMHKDFLTFQVLYSGAQYGKLVHSKPPVLNAAVMVHVTYHSSGITLAADFPPRQLLLVVVINSFN